MNGAVYVQTCRGCFRFGNAQDAARFVSMRELGAAARLGIPVRAIYSDFDSAADGGHKLAAAGAARVGGAVR